VKKNHDPYPIKSDLVMLVTFVWWWFFAASDFYHKREWEWRL